MSSLEKRQANRRGSTHGPRKCSDGISDTSSVGSLMDDTDREVSSLTDRAFRSLCIGEDAIYNDLEVSSPADQHKACSKEALQKKDLRTTCQKSSSHGIPHEEAERNSEMASTFQHSYVDIAQEHVLRDESLSYISNGSMEATWQQKRSTSRVSSLIKTFSSGDSYCDSWAPDTVKDKYRDFNNESWDKSALLSIQRELSEFSSGYHPNSKSGSLQSYGNHFHAVARMNTTTSSKTKFKMPNNTNFFFHSEFSPFQLWKDYNKFPFGRGESSGFVSATEFPRWYDSPLYKELKATHRSSSSPAEGRQLTRRKIEDVAAPQRSRSTVIQKASAIEKRCESELASNNPPWKNNNFVRNKLPSNRPNTVSPTNEKVHRPDSSLLYHSRHAYEIQHKAGKAGSTEMSSRTTPFNITQLLTPVIPGRQETETSEIFQFAHTPLVSEYDSDLKPQSDTKQLCDSYKSKASSLLFNLKDNRKRVKSTYSPTKFKGSEISDRNKQPSKLEGRESRLSETSGSKVTNQEHSTASGTWELCNPVQPNYELSLFQTTEQKQYADKSHNNLTSVSQYSATNCNNPYKNNHLDQLTKRESEHYELSTNSGLGNSGGSPVGHINDSTRTFGPTRPETESIFSKAELPAHLSAEISAKQTFCRREDGGQQNFVKRPSSGYINNQVTEENLSWKRTGPVNMVVKEMVNNNGIKDALPYKGEIAALIEMDKQRKATAKQYLPSGNEIYTTGNETWVNKMNENVNGNWLPKDKQFVDTKTSFQTYADKHFSNTQVKDDPTNTPATSQNVYEVQHNNLQKMASLPKDANFTRGSELTSTKHEKAEVCLLRNMRRATSDIVTEKGYSQRPQFLQSVEEKYQYNEGSVAFQPYKYESNKQWHISTTENRHAKDRECRSRQLQQPEMKAEQPGEPSHVHSQSKMSCVHQQSTAYSARTSQRNSITVDRAKTEEHKPTYSIVPSQLYHKQGNMNTDLNIPNTQRTLRNNDSSQTRGDKFNINDILSVRDNEQAKRVRENKHSFNGRVGNPTKSENLTSPVTSDMAEDIAAKTEPSKVQSQAQQDGNSHCKHENTNVSHGYVRKESHISNDMRERSGKDIFISNENDKIAPRALSYKEKGQTKQEILTSKLKAHAQKEISAIKEKGLAKHVIPSRNPIKQTIAIKNETGQINQEVLSPKKEITAEKLNHLFQDITYSSVPLYKEQRNQGKAEPKYHKITAEKVELLPRDMGSEKDKAAPEKERATFQMIKLQEEKITEVDKKNCDVQKFVQNYVYQPSVQSKENQLGKLSKDNEKERSTHDSAVANGTIPSKCFSSSPTLKVLSDEDSVVKKEDKTSSNLSTPYTSNSMEYSTFKANGNDSLDILVKAATNHLTLYNISGDAITLERPVNKAKEQLSKVNTDKSTAGNNTASLKRYDFQETTTSKDNTRKENPITLPTAGQLEINTRQDKTPSDWTKDEVPSGEMEFTDTETAFLNKQMANTEQEWEHLQSGVGGISENQTVLPESTSESSTQVYCTPNTEPPEKETWLEKQDIQADVIQTSVTNENSFLQQLHNNNTLNSSQSINLNKAVSMKVDSSEENKPKIKTMHCESSEVQETVSQLKFKIRHENQNEQMIRDKDVTENTNQQLQRDSERTPDTEHHNQKAKDSHEHIETTPTEKKQSNHDISNNDSKSPGTAHEKSEEEDFMPIITINSKDPQLGTHPPQDKSADSTNPVSESHVIHIASKEDKSPADEPIIYSICVSSTSKAVSEDEPIIYSISVSSSSDASMTTGPENQEKFQKHHSIEQVEKDDKETFGNKNKESVLLESKEDSKEGKLLLYNNMAEQETVVRKYDTPASKDKSDYYRSTELDNISSSYESLLAKYGLPNGDTIHLESDQKEQDKKQAEEKEESIHNSLEKIPNNTVYNDQAPVEERLTLADFTKQHSQESSKLKSPKASPELWRNAEENHGQCVTQSEQEHQTANGGGTQRADGVVHVDRNTKQDVSAKREIMMSMDVPVCEDIVDMRSAKQIMANGNVQQNENEQVGQKVQTMERGLKENDDDDDDDDVVNKNIEMVQVKCENDVKLTAGFSSDNISNKSINNSYDGSPQPSSKISTNACQLRIKAQETEVALVQNTQNADNQSGNTKSPVLQYRTWKECASDAPKHEQVSKEWFQTGDNKGVQNIRKELVCKSEFPELEQVKFMTSNNTKVSRVIVPQKEISAFTVNDQTKENSSVNHQSQLKYAFPAGKTDQSVCTLPDIPLEHKEGHKHGIENKTETDAVSTRAAVPINNVSENAQNTTPAKVTGTKASSAPSMTEDNLERFENEKWKREPAKKERQIIKDEITLFNNDPRTASSVIKGDKDAECESSKTDKPKEAKSQPQDKKDGDIEKLIIDNSRKNTGRKEIKTGIGTFKESSEIIRWDTETSGKLLGDKHDQHSNVYHPQTDALPEEMGNTYDGRNVFESKQNSQYHDKVLTKKEGTVTKTEVTQREKKMTRPEISALADYARLRVIAAEDDTITEKDLLQKMNTNQKYNLSAVEPQKVHFSMLVDGREQSKQRSINKKSENLNATTTTPLQVQEQRTYKITEEILAGHNQCSPRHELIASPKLGSLAKSSDDRVFAVNDTDSTKEKMLTNRMQSNTKKYLPAQDYEYSRSHEVYKPRNSQATHPLQSRIESQNDPKLKQPVNANIVERKVYPQTKNPQSAPQVPIETKLNNTNIHADDQIQEEAKAEESTEELQYYIVNAMEDETKPKNNQEPPSLSHKITSKKDLTEIHATAPQSNASSPAMGKATMFKVKDNTGKTSSVTKTVRPCFHRSFSEEFRIGSPADSCCGSEKNKVDFDHENHPKESANSPVLHEQSVTSHQLLRAKEIQARNRILSPGFMAPKEPRNYNRRRHISGEHESRSLVSTAPEDVESRAVSSVVVTDSRGFDDEHIRHTYARPESSCYERPESVCYERPESACSDMRATGRPPAVLPKTEKALRRAKRLTSRRIRKVDEKTTSDTPVQPENKSIRTVSSLPASPIVKTSAPQSVQASPPPRSHYQVEPNYAPPAPSIVAHSFPMTQRKLLQDPNSGQIFMVDMPVQVKTKTFFDPETGKYLQLNVRQRTQSALSQPASVEVLGHPYVVYPGFLPMSVSVSSLPSVRSSSQMSAPATLPDERNQLKASHEPSEQEIFGPERPRNVQQHNRPVYRTREQTGRNILQSGNVRMTPRQTHVITMTELEDFAMDNR